MSQPHKIFDKSAPRPIPMSWRARSTMGVERGGDILKIEGLDGDIPAYAYNEDKSAPKVIKRWPSRTNDAQGSPIPGDPIYQLIFHVQTEERDPANPLDNGQRTIWVEQTSLVRRDKQTNELVKITDTQWAAMVLALEAAGTPMDPKVGGKIYWTWTGERPGTGNNVSKLWSCRYVAPIAKAFSSDGDQVDQPASNGQGVHDPIATQRAALKLEIVGAETKQVLGKLFEAHHGTPVWTEELHELAMQRKAALEQPAPVASNPFL
jgi:hypothetical protein